MEHKPIDRDDAQIIKASFDLILMIVAGSLLASAIVGWLFYALGYALLTALLGN